MTTYALSRLIDSVYPTSISRVFQVETTWRRPFSRRFNVEYTWCVFRVDALDE